MPPALAKRPDLDEEQQEIWHDFARLAKSRAYAGMDGQPLPIPFEAMDRYAERFGPHDTDEFERWTGLIEAMDAVVLERNRKI